MRWLFVILMLISLSGFAQTRAVRTAQQTPRAASTKEDPDGKYVIIADRDSLLLSVNHGLKFRTLYRLPNPSTADIRGVDLTPNGKYIVIACSSDSIRLSKDYGRTFVGVNKTSASNVDVDMSSCGRYIIAAGTDGVVVSSDTGATWTTKSAGTSYATCAMTADGKNQVYAHTATGNMPFVSTDYGQNFSQTGVSRRYYDLDLSRNFTYWIATVDGGNYKSVNAGAAMSAVTGTGTGSMNGACGISNDGKYVLVGSQSTNSIKKSSDYNATFSTINGQPSPTLLFNQSCIAVSASGKYQYILDKSSTNDRIIRSKNYGTTFSRRYVNFTGNIECIAVGK